MKDVPANVKSIPPADKMLTLKRAAASLRHRSRHLFHVRRGANSLLNHFRGRVAILVYHRVACHVPDPHLLCVSPDHFAQHLNHLAKHYHIINLSQLEAGLNAGKLPSRSIAITFDDGYMDNLTCATPLLERFGLPATVFVISGALRQRGELLSDELERILLASPRLPKAFSLEIAGKKHSWNLPEEPAQRTAWTMSDGNFPSARHMCFRQLHSILLPLSHKDRVQALHDLALWAGIGASDRNDRYLMNIGELKDLTRSGLIAVGAHTVNHVLLAARPVSEQRQEISQSREDLEEALGARVASFAYPYGGPNAMTQETVMAVREAGFSNAFANVNGLVTSASDPFLLPRCMVLDWPELQFAQNLKRWFCD